MLFYGIPMETQLNICVFPQNYRIEKPKTHRNNLTCFARSLGEAKASNGALPRGDHHWGSASIFAWQCRRESEYLSLVWTAWCRTLKEAGLLHVGRENPIQTKEISTNVQKGCHMQEGLNTLNEGRDFQQSEPSRDGIGYIEAMSSPSLQVFK